MQALPHFYTVTATATPEGAIGIATEEGAELLCFPPVQFGGEPGRQSPESLLTGAVASCFHLTFRAVAAASKFAWLSLECQVVGQLDKVDGRLAFSGFELKATLRLPAGEDRERALKLLEKSERNCLVSASLACPVRLVAEVVTA